MTCFLLFVPCAPSVFFFFFFFSFFSHKGGVFDCMLRVHNTVWGRGEQLHIQSIGGSKTLGLRLRPCARLTGLVIVCLALHTISHTHQESGLCLLKCLTAVSPLTHIWLLVLPPKTPLCTHVCVPFPKLLSTLLLCCLHANFLLISLCESQKIKNKWHRPLCYCSLVNICDDCPLKETIFTIIFGKPLRIPLWPFLCVPTQMLLEKREREKMHIITCPAKRELHIMNESGHDYITLYLNVLIFWVSIIFSFLNHSFILYQLLLSVSLSPFPFPPYPSAVFFWWLVIKLPCLYLKTKCIDMF